MWLRQIPNLLTLGRMILVWPMVESLRSGRYDLALGLFFVAAASDGIDGFLARRFDWRTRLGDLLDPAADKLLMISLYVALWLIDQLPLPLVAAVLLRDVVIVGGVALMNLRYGSFVPEPRMPSKLNTAMLAALGLMVLADLAWGVIPALALEVGGALLLVTTVVSGVDYVLSWGQRVIARGGRDDG